MKDIKSGMSYWYNTSELWSFNNQICQECWYSIDLPSFLECSRCSIDKILNESFFPQEQPCVKCLASAMLLCCILVTMSEDNEIFSWGRGRPGQSGQARSACVDQQRRMKLILAKKNRLYQLEISCRHSKINVSIIWTYLLQLRFVPWHCWQNIAPLVTSPALAVVSWRSAWCAGDQ